VAGESFTDFSILRVSDGGDKGDEALLIDNTFGLSYTVLEVVNADAGAVVIIQEFCSVFSDDRVNSEYIAHVLDLFVANNLVKFSNAGHQGVQSRHESSVMENDLR
jgi:hypothetical protein